MTDAEAVAALLAVADGLFYDRGIAGVGMSDVRDESGVSLRRLYHLYPSKRDLVAAWLNDRHIRWMAWFVAATDARIADGVDAVVAPFDAIEEWASSPGYRGCAFLNAIAETTEIDEGHRQIVADHKRSLIEYLRRIIDSSGHAAPWLPDAVAVLVDGAIVQSAALRSHAPIAAARSAAVGALVGVR